MSNETLVLLENLFFAAKINEAAARTGTQLRYARTAAKALQLARESTPSLIIIDLDAAACSPIEAIKEIRTLEQFRQTPILGFVSHVNTGLQAEARAAGCDRVVARSAFSRDLLAILAPKAAENRSDGGKP